MTRRMTTLHLPGSGHGGIMDYDEVAPADIIAMARRWAANDKARAEELLAASDADFRIELVEGVHKQRRLKVIQEGRPALAAGSRRAKTAQPVECEASQSGAQRNAQTQSRNPHDHP